MRKINVHTQITHTSTHTALQYRYWWNKDFGVHVDDPSIGQPQLRCKQIATWLFFTALIKPTLSLDGIIGSPHNTQPYLGTNTHRVNIQSILTSIFKFSSIANSSAPSLHLTPWRGRCGHLSVLRFCSSPAFCLLTSYPQLYWMGQDGEGAERIVSDWNS